MKDRALIVFTKNPVKGEVKTRLAKTVGEEKALEIFRELLHIAYVNTKSLPCDKYLYLSGSLDENLFDPGFFQKIQEGINLGERMLNALSEILDTGYERVILVGTDCPGLTRVIIKDAFNKLNDNDIVLGPAEDGGYYLVGLKEPIEYLFKDMRWGHQNVLSDTLKRIKENKHSYELVAKLIDIDDAGDLEKAKKEMMKR